VNGNVFSNGQVIAETFNKYFVTVAQNIHASNYNPNASSQHENPISYLCRAFNRTFPTINFKYVSSKEIEVITKALKTKNSHGHDEISTKILKYSIYYISSHLSYICNRMLTSGIFPTCLKFAEVTPTFKKGDKNATSNYRPIFLHHFQRFLKRLFIIEFFIILIIITFLLMNNLVSGLDYQQTLHLTT
jgi:hypothetical protein